MIIPNGTISYRLHPDKPQPDMIDPRTGYPVKAEPRWSDPAPCQIITGGGGVNLAERTQEDGAAVSRIPIEILTDITTPIHGLKVRVTYDNGTDLGERTVTLKEELRAVCQIKLRVES